MDPIVLTMLLLIVGVCLFFVLREVWCWYWKINRIEALLSAILAAIKGTIPQGQAHAVPIGAEDP